MRLRNNKSITENLQDPNDSILEDGVSPTPRKRNNRSSSSNRQGNRSRKRNKKASITDDQIDTSSNEVGNSQSSKNIVGVTKRNGKYGVKIHDRIRKKDVWLGTYESAEEARRVYWAKKEELEKEFEALALRVSEPKRTSEYLGVSMRASGKFAAHIRDPIRKKKLYLGAFDSEEEASKAYSAKKAELEKEVKGKKGVGKWCERRICRRATSLDLRKRRSVGESGQCNNQESSMESHHVDASDDETASIGSGISKNDDQCLVQNQESSKEIDNSVSLNGENGPSNAGEYEENLPILEQNNEDPCSDNQESSKEEIDHLDSSHKEATSVDSDNQESSKEDIDHHLDSSHKEATSVDSHNQESSEDIDHLDSSHKEATSVDLDNQESSKEDIDHLDSSHKEATSVDSDNQESSKEDIDHLDSSHKEATSVDSDNQESSKEEIDHLDSSHKEATSMDCGEDDLPIEDNGAEKELIVVDSSVESLDNPGRCSDGKILLRTKSGTPLMDCNGYLLGEWSCIDDLSLSSNL